MQNLTINFDEQELQDMMYEFPDEGNKTMFSWTLITDEGTEVEVIVTVGADPETLIDDE